MFALAASRTSAAAASFALDAAAARLRTYLARAVPAALPLAAPRAGAAAARGDRRARPEVLHPLIEYFRLQPDLEVRVDHWAALGEHDESVSRELAEWADVIVCEWCGPNAVWYSRHKRRSARLLVRLHRFELYSPYPAQVKIGNVDQVICVSDYYARLTREKTGWPAAKIVTVPNALDVLQFDRPKLDGARFHLGMTSMVDMRKRVDLALDVLEELRRDDDRYQLFVKSGMPWELWWVWQHQEQRSPLLRGVPPGAALPAAARRRGVRRRRARRARLAAQDRVHPVDQRRRVVPHGARRGHGVAGGAGDQALAGRGDDLRHALDQGKPGGDGRVDRRPVVAEAWEAARQAAHQQIRAFDLGTVAETWLRPDPRRVPGGATGPARA